MAMSQIDNEQNQPGSDEPLHADPGAPATDQSAEPVGAVSSDEKLMAMLCHLLAIFTGFIAPLIIWLVKKDQSAFINHHGRESLNFQITFLIAYLISYVLIFVVVGCFLLPAVMVTVLVFCIMASIAANNGQYYRYPLAIRFIK
jgi:hypothetical protein